MGVINQDGVAAGHKSIESAIAEQIKTLEIFPQLECILFSPTYSGSRMILVDRHRDGSNEKIVIDIEPVGFSDSWKPAPGMLEYYLSDYCKKDYQALMVGDRPEDRDVAKAAKIPFQWANEWREDLREV